MHHCCRVSACILQIQRNLATDGGTEEVQKVALLPDSKLKVGASLGYTVRTLLKDLGMEVRCPTSHLISASPVLTIVPVRT